MTVAVTAVSGQLGHSIVKALQDQNKGEEIIGLARTPEHVRGLDIEIRPGDYSDPAQLEKSMAGVDVVLLVSGNDEPEARYTQHCNAINAAKAAGVRKVIYTSVQGTTKGASGAVVDVNRRTEEYLKNSGLEWVIGRNGVYIEPDVEYIDSYVKAGEIVNCADQGKCAYTTRPELAAAYAALMQDDRHNGQTYNLHGHPITQGELASYLNLAFGTDLKFRSMSPADYLEDRSAELGPFMGAIITGIYEGIRRGDLDNESDFEAVTGRPHQSWDAYFTGLKT